MIDKCTYTICTLKLFKISNFIKKKMHFHSKSKVQTDMKFEIVVRIIQPERFSTESAKTKVSYKYWIMEVNDLVQFCKYAKRGASEVKKIEFFYSTFWKILNQNLHQLINSEHKFMFDVWKWCVFIKIKANIGTGKTWKSKFSKLVLTSKFHLFFWSKNTTCFNFKL